MHKAISDRAESYARDARKFHDAGALGKPIMGAEDDARFATIYDTIARELRKVAAETTDYGPFVRSVAELPRASDSGPVDMLDETEAADRLDELTGEARAMLGLDEDRQPGADDGEVRTMGDYSQADPHPLAARGREARTRHGEALI